MHCFNGYSRDSGVRVAVLRTYATTDTTQVVSEVPSLQRAGDKSALASGLINATYPSLADHPFVNAFEPVLSQKTGQWELGIYEVDAAFVETPKRPLINTRRMLYEFMR